MYICYSIGQCAAKVYSRRASVNCVIVTYGIIINVMMCLYEQYLATWLYRPPVATTLSSAEQIISGVLSGHITLYHKIQSLISEVAHLTKEQAAFVCLPIMYHIMSSSLGWCQRPSVAHVTFSTCHL
jgi:hypothetical protein